MAIAKRGFQAKNRLVSSHWGHPPSSAPAAEKCGKGQEKGERRAGRKSSGQEEKPSSLASCASGCIALDAVGKCFFLSLDPQLFSQDLSFSQCLSHQLRHGIIFIPHIYRSPWLAKAS